MNENLHDQLARVGRQLEAQGFVVCPKCFEDVTRLRPEGICAECAYKVWKSKPMPSKTEEAKKPVKKHWTEKEEERPWPEE